MHMLDFRVASSQLGNTTVVAISGELDMHTAERVATKLRDASANANCCVVVDLLETTLVDSVGIGILAAAARLVRSKGGTFLLAADDPRFLRTLKITGLDRLFDIEPTLMKAVERVVERVPAAAAV
jgi:anti-sigma B factor antagonist